MVTPAWPSRNFGVIVDSPPSPPPPRVIELFEIEDNEEREEDVEDSNCMTLLLAVESMTELQIKPG